MIRYATDVERPRNETFYISLNKETRKLEVYLNTESKAFNDVLEYCNCLVTSPSAIDSRYCLTDLRLNYTQFREFLRTLNNKKARG